MSLMGFVLSVAMTLSSVVFDVVATGVRALGLVTAAPTSTVQYRGATKPLREAVEDTTQRVSARTLRSAARSVGSAFGEAVPFIGVPVVVAATAWELYDACQTMQDLGELTAAIDPQQAVDPASVCGLTPPSLGELSWGAISAGQEAVDGAMAELGGGPPANREPVP